MKLTRKHFKHYSEVWVNSSCSSEVYENYKDDSSSYFRFLLKIPLSELFDYYTQYYETVDSIMGGKAADSFASIAFEFACLAAIIMRRDELTREDLIQFIKRFVSNEGSSTWEREIVENYL